ncbi:MAG: hypothetical protein ACREIT_04345 [Tepidisphaeraceae bacterium]
MVRTTVKIVLLFALVVTGAVGVWQYYDHTSADRKIQKLEEEKRQLEQVVERLSTERRVADVLVTDQRTGPDGVLSTTLLFQEYARDGASLPARQFTIKGKTAHVDALVIKFEHDFVRANDPLRGHTIVLFDKLYGDHENPAQAARIDEPGRIPEIYRGADPKISEFERDLWANFWKLADDAAYRQGKGVRIANGQGVWGPFERDKLYTLTVESDGGLNITSEPLKGIYREALKRLGE